LGRWGMPSGRSAPSSLKINLKLPIETVMGPMGCEIRAAAK
jgi:hypothetical protein